MITISRSDDVITIKGHVTKPELDNTFDISADVLDFTNFVINVSRFDSPIDIAPPSLEAYKALDTTMSHLHEQVVSYIYKILEAFNESYKSVYQLSEPPF